jgi:hypothetical protein
MVLQLGEMAHCAPLSRVSALSVFIERSRAFNDSVTLAD